MKFYFTLILTSLTAYSAQAMELIEPAAGCASISPLDSPSKSGRVSATTSSETVFSSLAPTPFSMPEFTGAASAGTSAPTVVKYKDSAKLAAAEAQRRAEATEWQSYLNKQHHQRVMNLIALDYFKNSRSRADYESSPLIMEQLYANSLFRRKLKAERATKIAIAACVIATDPSLASSPGRKLLELNGLSRAASSEDATRLIEAQKDCLLPEIRRMPKLKL